MYSEVCPARLILDRVADKWTTLVMGVLSEADGPVRFDHIVSQVILAKGIEPDGHLRKHTTDTTRATLGRLGARGVVRRVLDEPDVWWEFVLVRREG